MPTKEVTGFGQSSRVPTTTQQAFGAKKKAQISALKAMLKK